MRSCIGLLLPVVLLAFACSGCGESVKKTTSSSPSAAPTESPTTPDAPPAPPRPPKK